MGIGIILRNEATLLALQSGGESFRCLAQSAKSVYSALSRVACSSSNAYKSRYQRQGSCMAWPWMSGTGAYDLHLQ